MTGPVIAVDGPAASGKGTIAKALAHHFGLPFLDTGLLYRATWLILWREGRNLTERYAADAARRVDEVAFDDPELRGEGASKGASVVSAYPTVREALLQHQRAFASQPGGAVLDGRDIGTVIAPSADAKLFVTASLEVRARRRWAELRSRGENVDPEFLLVQIQSRDARDSQRASAPLAMAPDAALLDTSDLAIDAAVQRAVALVEDRLEARRVRLRG